MTDDLVEVITEEEGRVWVRNQWAEWIVREKAYHEQQAMYMNFPFGLISHGKLLPGIVVAAIVGSMIIGAILQDKRPDYYFEWWKQAETDCRMAGGSPHYITGERIVCQKQDKGLWTRDFVKP